MTTPSCNIVLICFASAPTSWFDPTELHEPQDEVLLALAREGLRFTHAFTNSPGPIEALVSLFCGLAPAAHGATSESPQWPRHVPDAVNALGSLGYNTVAICPDRAVAELVRGGTRFDWFLTSRWRLASFVERAWSLGRQVAGRWLDGGEALGQRTNLAFFRWLDGHSSARPFFAWLYYPAPVAERHRGRASGSETAASLAAKHLSGVVRALEQRGLWERTALVVTALRGAARTQQNADSLAENVVRVPLLFRLPPPAPAGFIVEEFCQLSDVFPTLLHFAGCPEPSGASGFGRVLIRENRVAPGPRAVVVEEYRSRALAQGASCSGYRRRLLRTNRFRFVWRSDEVNELYDLMVDPVGQRDLALERPELAAAMRVHLFEWLAFHHGSRQGAMTPDVQQIQQSALRVVL